MGIIYCTKENVIPNSELKKSCESNLDQADIWKENTQQIIIPGDFNGKTGNHINSNSETIKKRGRHSNTQKRL